MIKYQRNSIFEVLNKVNDFCRQTGKTFDVEFQHGKGTPMLVITPQKRQLVFDIPSDTELGKTYTVVFNPLTDTWLCSCPDFLIRRFPNGEDCKHITRAKMQ